MNKDSKKLSPPLRAVDVIPHRGVMKQIDDLLEWSNDGAVGVAVIDRGNAFVSSSGTLNSLVFIEMIAQVAAARSAALAIERGCKPKSGFLVGIKDFEIFKLANIGESLRIDINETMNLENVCILNGSVYLADAQLARGAVKVWEDAIDLKTDGPAEQHGAFPEDGPSCASQCCLLEEKLSKSITDFSFKNNEKQILAAMHFDPNFIGFQGHFQGYPILPGVLMLLMAQVLLQKANISRTLNGVEQAKFSRQVFPGQTLNICLILPDDECGGSMTLFIKRDEQTVASVDFATH